MKIKIANVIRVEDPTPDFKKWCDTELTIANPEYAKKERLGFWTGSTPKKLFLYSKQGDAYILPVGMMQRLLDLFYWDEAVLDIAKDPSFPYITFPEIPLYDYQQKAVNLVSLYSFGILQAPAGSGKTQMGLALVQRQGRRALWLTHTKDLLNQSMDRAKQYWDPSLMGTITEGKVDIGEGITFATIQTMTKLDPQLYADVFDTVIVDECHRVCGTPSTMTMFYKVLNGIRAAHKYGLSATVHRADGMIKATYAVLGDILYEVTDSAVRDKIVKVGVRSIPTYANLPDGCLGTDGTINYTKMINGLCEDFHRNDCIMDAIIAEEGKSCLILSDRIGHLETLRNSLPDRLWKDSCIITGKMTSKRGKKEREEALEDMRSGKKKYLFATYQLAKEGLDIPRLERLFLTTPQKDYAVIAQSVGRVARAFEGKADPVVIDFVDHVRMLVGMYRKRWSTYRKIGCYEVD